jgi:hypothetical protein
MRRAKPCNALLPATMQWAASLDGVAAPYRLMAQYPRIANRIANAWNDVPACLVILDELLVDRRGGRKGFPEPVRDELRRLRQIHDAGRSTD